jgi:mevalonate kinase
MMKTMYKLSIHHLHHICLKMMTRMRELKMKILMSLMNKPRHKLKMLMLSNPLLKWLIEETHLYFRHIHKISS